MNKHDRVAARYEIIRCQGDHCEKDISKIRRVLDTLIFRFRTTYTMIEFDKSKINDQDVTVFDSIHSQW